MAFIFVDCFVILIDCRCFNLSEIAFPTFLVRLVIFCSDSCVHEFAADHLLILINHQKLLGYYLLKDYRFSSNHLFFSYLF